MRRLIPFIFALPLALTVMSGGANASTTQPDLFTFNWTATPAAPEPWVPGALNDWDLIANIDGPTDNNGTMDAGHGADCSPPPATHQVTTLAESVFLCKGHMMTAIYGGGNAFVGYGAIYFAPAQLVDWSSGTARITWKISTERTSTRDWWAVNLSPFDENLVVPGGGSVAYNGNPPDGLSIYVDNGVCRRGIGTVLRMGFMAGSSSTDLDVGGACVEDVVPPSAATRTEFELDVAAGHVKLWMPGTQTVFYDGPANLNFKRAVLQLSHHSYNPAKGEAVNTGGSGAGPGRPNTFHWSDISISPAVPFTMLRPQQPFSLHDGRAPTLTLPRAAPANAFLRFAALGDPEISLDGGPWQPARVQGSYNAGEHFASFWTPVPEGTTRIAIRGRPNGSGLAWWVEDVSVWSLASPDPNRPAVVEAPASQPPVAAATAGTSSTVTTTGPKRSRQAQPPLTGLWSQVRGVAHAIGSSPQREALAAGAVLILLGCVGGAGYIFGRRRRRQAS